MGHKKSIGLRGGPNEYITDISEFVSIEGYKRNSPDVNNPYNIIESGNITMEGVDFPVYGRDNLGNEQIMEAGGGNYQFPGDRVLEIPMAKRGGGLLNKTMECNSCGWEWKAADGGNDVSTCHKCGSSALPKAQAGGARIEAQADREDQAKRKFKINRETGDAVVFVESPTIERRIYDLYNPYAVNSKNMPSTLKEFQNQFNLGESKLKVIQDERQLLIKNDKETQRLYKVYSDLRDQKRIDYEIRAKEPGFDRSSFMESPEYEKIADEMDNAGTAYNNRRREITDPFDLKYKNETERYGKIINDNQKNFLDNKLNPITRRMDSTFYKEAENLKKVYGKLHPNSNVDIVPIYDNPDLIRDKVSGLNPNDSMYFFGHSGDRLGGIPNQEVATILADSEAENCYLGSCGFEGQIEPFQKALQGKNLQYRPEGSWWGVNPGGSSIEDAMWSRVDNNKNMDVEGSFSSMKNGAKVIKPTLGKDYNQLQRGGEQFKAQDGTETEEKSVWGFVKELAKIPGANVSNLLGVMGIPANLIAEATESLTGRGDGEFNFMDAMPSFATPGSDDEAFTFTNQNNTPVKNVAGLEDADGNPLVENPVGAFITNLATDPSTYVGAGVAKNVANKVTQEGFKRGLRKTIAKNIPRKVKTPIEGTDMIMTTNSKLGQAFDKTGIPKMLWPKGFGYGADEAGKSFVATAQNASGDIIDLSKYADNAGDYFTFDNAFVKNPMTAGRSMKAMEKSIPKYGVIKQNPAAGSLSEDSFTMMLQRLKDGKKFKDVTDYGESVFLNRSGTNRIVKPGPTNQMLVNQNLFDASEVAALNTKYGKVFDKLKNKGVLNDEFRGFGTREIKIPGLADKVYQVGVPNIGVQKLYQKGREVREIAQDNTRVVKPRIYDIEPKFKSKSNNFLSNPNLDYDPLNNERIEIARDNTSVSGINKLNDKFLTNRPQLENAKVNVDEVMNSIKESEEFDSRKYDDPVLIADFIKNSNFYSDGWKDMSNATEQEVLDLQNVLVEKGYNVGLTGVDGKYGDKTYQAHKNMVDDNNLDPNVISRYYKNYKEDTKEEVKAIQEKLIDAGYLDEALFNSSKSSVDGKFGDQTKIALDAYNTDNIEEDPQGEVYNNIPSTLEETRCAAGMCTILEGNEVLTEALGVKYKDAWDLSESMINANNSKEIYNIYTNPAFKDVNENTSTDELKKTTRKVKKNSQTKSSDYKVGDIVGLYWDGSSHHEETLGSKTYNTHSGFVSAINDDGVPIITHNVAGDVRQQPYSELTTAWIRRPDEDIKVKSTYDTTDIDSVVADQDAINNLGLRYQTNYQENPERLNQIETIFQRAKYNSQKIPKILNSSVDSNWLESAVIGITGVESGVGNSAPRTVEEARGGKGGLQGVGYDLFGKGDGSISLGIGKRKFDGLDSFAKKYFQINSVEDLADDSKSVDAITYGITKSYETFKDYAKQYPELGLTEEDIRNMSILSYNQGENKLLQTGRVDDKRTPQEEVEELRKLYDAMVTDVSSTNYRFLNKTGLPIGDLAYNTALGLGAEQAAPSYINKVNQYIKDLFPTQIAMVETEDPFRTSVLAKGGEYGVYNNYMNGKYEGTPREKYALNLYDKLNRVHYKDAKKENMSSPNYIMSHVYKA